MTSKLELDEFCCIKHCLGVSEHNSIVNSVSVDDWIAEWVIIASNEQNILVSEY